MRPIKLTMKAFGSYGRTTEVDFTKPAQNLFLVSGDTGSGKTTIFDALMFALYGEASSSNNKKSGMELQSDYVSFETEPFVELVFSEQTGEGDGIYTVRRVPRHFRAKKKKQGNADARAIGETVELTLPDGTDHPGKLGEINRRLEEIVGLSKAQFMQVAMIAQGEFMEMLRAKSDEKKVIFRKLFHTELYEQITVELGNRSRAGHADLAKIFTECKTEAAHILVPEEYEKAEELGQVLHRFTTADKMNVTDLETMMKDLLELCGFLKEKKEQAGQEYQVAGQLRDQKRDAYTEADHLEKFFLQMESAEKDLNACRAQEEEMKEASLLSRKIRDAYEIRSHYLRFSDADKQVRQTKENLKKQQEKLPELKQEAESAAQSEQTAEKLWSEAEKSLVQAREQKKQKLKSFEDCLDAAERAVQEEQDKETLKKTAEQSARAYVKARAAHDLKKQEHECMQKAFLDAQAGFLAREFLKEGEPCPVCGSLSHPAPCLLAEEHRELTREGLDQLASEVSLLNKALTEKTEESGAAASRLTEAEKHLTRTMQQLKKLTAEILAGQELPEKISAAELQKKILERQEAVQREENEKVRAAEQAAKRAKKDDQEAKNKSTAARNLQSTTEGKIRSYSDDLPGLQQQLEEQHRAYEGILTEKSAKEAEWQELVSLYPASKADELQEKMLKHEQKRAAATALQTSSRQAIGERKRPDLDLLFREKEESQQLLDGAEVRFNRLKEEEKTNRQVYDALAPRQEERSWLLAECNRLDSLYTRFAGKVSGSRMDIETFVQRYYLERILEAANLRFQHMSAGQFELRMYDLEKAGEGKNHGLDLMVYSNVTGKVREVRTLSGGESFMAALSLALGMADQIQERSAFIHPDVMFIDEGFGSLDDHARSQAVRVLKQMAGGSRLIGIISHVTELKQEIEDQLLVEKDENGSRVRWV